MVGGVGVPYRVGAVNPTECFTVILASSTSFLSALYDTGRNKMFAKRDPKSQFKEMDDVGRSLAADRRKPPRRFPNRGRGSGTARVWL